MERTFEDGVLRGLQIAVKLAEASIQGAHNQKWGSGTAGTFPVTPATAGALTAGGIRDAISKKIIALKDLKDIWSDN